ncbi:Uncharacterized protein FWK35_00020924 [Aphis craccivora]|uniref:Uncharacterized protein n=1 Tax=Aphis craccivora TaxID=307492 RepID=A0A6G0YQC4_APHCR|nr:Uncharacterized protein FWK35_00020924 [Aphis craccivora]
MFRCELAGVALCYEASTERVVFVLLYPADIHLLDLILFLRAIDQMQQPLSYVSRKTDVVRLVPDHNEYLILNGVMNIITSRNNASISIFGDGFLWKNEYPWCIIEVKIPHNSNIDKHSI